jgi:hypothetical protein
MFTIVTLTMADVAGLAEKKILDAEFVKGQR